MTNKTTARRPTGKRGRGLPARDGCCACQNSGLLRLGNGKLVDCTNTPMCHRFREQRLAKSDHHSDV